MKTWRIIKPADSDYVHLQRAKEVESYSKFLWVTRVSKRLEWETIYYADPYDTDEIYGFKTDPEYYESIHEELLEEDREKERSIHNNLKNLPITFMTRDKLVN